MNKEVEEGMRAATNLKLMLELKDGHFRYWVRHAMVPFNSPKLPLTGEYTIEKDTITLHTDQINPGDYEASPVVWTFKSLDGVLTLWPADRVKVYREGQRLPVEVIMHHTEHWSPEVLWKNGLHER